MGVNLDLCYWMNRWLTGQVRVPRWSARSGGATAESHCDGFEPALGFKTDHRFKSHKHMQSPSCKIRLFVSAHQSRFDKHILEWSGPENRLFTDSSNSSCQYSIRQQMLQSPKFIDLIFMKTHPFDFLKSYQAYLLLIVIKSNIISIDFKILTN